MARKILVENLLANLWNRVQPWKYLVTGGKKMPGLNRVNGYKTTDICSCEAMNSFESYEQNLEMYALLQW